jgi:two-component system, chemotaxis family, CheB/CheR fusion protein
LHLTTQENRLLLDSSSSVILKLTTDWKIMEFNSAAETFFGKKREDVTGHNYLELFIPESARKETAQRMNKLLKKTENKNIKLKVIAAGAKKTDIEWSVSVHCNSLLKPSEITLITN